MRFLGYPDDVTKVRAGLDVFVTVVVRGPAASAQVLAQNAQAIVPATFGMSAMVSAYDVFISDWLRIAPRYLLKARHRRMHQSVPSSDLT